MLRGADRRIMFSDTEDCERFLDTMRRVKSDSDFKLFSYCLMGNHVHLLIKEETIPLEVVFKRIGSSYVYYYNWKYQLHGHLLQDRFRSEKVEDDPYFLDVLRYICQNPVKAGLSKTPFEYPWLGCSRITSDERLLDDLGETTDMNRQELMSFVSQPVETEHLDDTGMVRLTDREAMERLCAACGCDTVQEIGGWSAERREEAARTAREIGISVRQLSRLTGISKTTIERMMR